MAPLIVAHHVDNKMHNLHSRM